MESDAIRIAIGAWVVAVGAALGSFLNVVIARVPAGESIVSPGSRCPRCASPIRWWDNVPVVSWLALRGRCRRCGEPISPRYLLVEVAGAAVALVAWGRHGLTGAAAAELVFVDVLLALSLIDLATWLLPHALTWPLLGAGVVASALGVSAAPSLLSSVEGAGIGFAAFAAIAWLGKLVFRKEAMGLGDVWLLAGIGAWAGMPALLPIVLLASIQGSVVGLALVALGKGQPGPAPTAPDAPAASEAPGAPEVRAPSGAPAASEAPATSDASATSEAPGASEVPAVADAPAAPEAPAASDEEPWVSPKNAVPFGPFLALGAVEWLWLGDRIAALVPALKVFW